MKQLILILLFFLFCGSPSDTTAPELVRFNAVAGSKYIENEEVKIYHDLTLKTFGKLPLPLEAYTGDILTAHFEARVSNFPINHPQCDCEELAYNHYKCTEDFEVTGNEWEVAK
jgi:hypothetical protein